MSDDEAHVHKLALPPTLCSSRSYASLECQNVPYYDTYGSTIQYNQGNDMAGWQDGDWRNA
jgi:hypothetical protein